MPRIARLVSPFVIAILACACGDVAAQASQDSGLLKTRESVWRAWFADDAELLRALVPEDTLVISSGERTWKKQADVFRSAEDFHRAGGKLVRLEFPKTEVQHFGDVAVIWSEYLVETEVAGKRSVSSGRVTEIFVHRDGRWVNPSWHTDSEH